MRRSPRSVTSVNVPSPLLRNSRSRIPLSRTTHDRKAAVRAIHSRLLRARKRCRLQTEIDIPRHEEVHQPIVVIVEPRRARIYPPAATPARAVTSLNVPFRLLWNSTFLPKNVR